MLVGVIMEIDGRMVLGIRVHITKIDDKFLVGFFLFVRMIDRYPVSLVCFDNVLPMARLIGQLFHDIL